jgi:hypothetical protein
MSLLLKKAEALATKAHGTQKRKFDNSPYINHLLEVKAILEHFEFKDETLLCAALLHDVLEDTRVESHDIEKVFGGAVISLVEELTDDKTLSLPERRKATINKLSVQPHDIHAIKLADLISNLSAIPPIWTEEKRKDYCRWCEALIAACNKAPLDMIKFAEYLLWNQLGESDDFVVLRRWAQRGNLYWSEDKRAMLFVGFSEIGDVEARIMSGETEPLNAFFSLGLLRELSVDFTNPASVLVVNTLPKSMAANFDGYYLDCHLVGLKDS